MREGQTIYWANHPNGIPAYTKQTLLQADTEGVTITLGTMDT